MAGQRHFSPFFWQLWNRQTYDIFHKTKCSSWNVQMNKRKTKNLIHLSKIHSLSFNLLRDRCCCCVRVFSLFIMEQLLLLLEHWMQQKGERQYDDHVRRFHFIFCFFVFFRFSLLIFAHFHPENILSLLLHKRRMSMHWIGALRYNK